MNNEEAFSSFLKIIGSNVQRFRLTEGFTQNFLAEKSGVSRSSIANLENGRAAVSLYSMFLIAKALRIEISDLISKPK